MREMTFDEAIQALKHAVYGEEVRYAIARALELSMNTQQSVAGKEDASNKKTTLTGNESSNDFYPTTKAVADALNTKASLSTAYTFDSTTATVTYNANNPKKIYTNAYVNGKNAFVLTTANNYFQIALCCDGSEYIRQLTSSGSTTYNPWLIVKNESSNNKQSSITAYNEASPTMYPSIKAVVDYLAEKYEALSNKLTSEAGIDEDSTDTEYPTAKAVFNFGTDILDEVAGDLVLKESFSNKKNAIAGNETSEQYYPTTKAVYDYLVANYENSSNKLTSEEGIDSNSTDTQYPTAKAVYDLGVEILALVNDDISNVESRLVLKESFSNKKNAIAGNETSNQFYPTTKAVYDYGTTITNNIEDVKAYIGYTSDDILGLQADFENERFTRLGAAVGLSAGADFDQFTMYGGRKRCNVSDDGTITAYYGDEGFAEDGSNGQVMVYQPKFYYKVVPLKLEPIAGGIGYHIRKANYYVTANPHPGFKLHPLFYDANGNEVDYVLLSAYEGSMYDVSEEAYVNDSVDTTVAYGAGDLLCSVAGKKPISGKLSGVGTKANFETMANNIGSGWHLNTIKAESANQLLMLIELGRFNTQAAIGKGVGSCPSNGTYNCSSYTGSTASLGNATGMATETTYESAGTETVNTTNGKLSVTYRGVENPWGNIWKHTNGINLWGDGHMGGGQVFICDDFSFNESKHDGNYQSAGFTISNGDGYVSAFGYGDEEFDWLFMPSETAGNSSLPVGDSYWCQPNLNGYRTATLGGYWNYGDRSGGFYWACNLTPSVQYHYIGGRLLYVPTATV